MGSFPPPFYLRTEASEAGGAAEGNGNDPYEEHYCSSCPMINTVGICYITPGDVGEKWCESWVKCPKKGCDTWWCPACSSYQRAPTGTQRGIHVRTHEVLAHGQVQASLKTDMGKIKAKMNQLRVRAEEKEGPPAEPPLPAGPGDPSPPQLQPTLTAPTLPYPTPGAAALLRIKEFVDFSSHLLQVQARELGDQLLEQVAKIDSELHRRLHLHRTRHPMVTRDMRGSYAWEYANDGASVVLAWMVLLGVVNCNAASRLEESALNVS